jgi:septal ring factor EnvC (AmiA/AmiB activator)
MTDFVTLADTLIRDWWLLIFFFTLGGIWWQLKHWFNQVNKNMDYVTKEHEAQNQILGILHEKVINIEQDVSDIKRELTTVHEEVHEQEVKLAVLENERSPTKRRKVASA